MRKVNSLLLTGLLLATTTAPLAMAASRVPTVPKITPALRSELLAAMTAPGHAWSTPAFMKEALAKITNGQIKTDGQASERVVSLRLQGKNEMVNGSLFQSGTASEWTGEIVFTGPLAQAFVKQTGHDKAGANIVTININGTKNKGVVGTRDKSFVQTMAAATIQGNGWVGKWFGKSAEGSTKFAQEITFFKAKPTSSAQGSGYTHGTGVSVGTSTAH